MAEDRKRMRKDKISFLVNGRKGIGLLFRHKKRKVKIVYGLIKPSFSIRQI